MISDHQKYGRIIVKEKDWRETEHRIPEEKFTDGTAKHEDGKNYVMRNVWKVQEETIPFWVDGEYIRSCIEIPVG